MRLHKITGLITDTAVYPTADDQGATKIYVDEQRQKIIDQALTLVDDGVY